MKLTKFAISLSAVIVAAGAQAQGFAYGVDVNHDLYRINLSNASSTIVGNANGGTFESLGMDPSGTLYGANTNGELYSISTSNAVATFIGNTGLGNIEGMDWDALNGRMLVSDFSGTPSIYSVNLTNASTQLEMTASSSGSVIRSLATRATGAVVDIRSDGGSQQGDIHGTFNMGSGAYSTVGTAGDGCLAIDYGLNGTLYGLTSAGDLVSINPGTGAFQTVGTVHSGSFFLGMATDVVPEPASMIVFGLGLAAVARRRRRKA